MRGSVRVRGACGASALGAAFLGAGTTVPNPVPPEEDARLLPTVSVLDGWWRADINNTISATPRYSGTTPPAVTFSGAGLSSGGIYGPVVAIETDTTKCRWSLDGGWTWGARNVTFGSTLALGASGITANLPTANGTTVIYNANNVFTGVTTSVGSIVNASGRTLDNSTVLATTGPDILPRGINNSRAGLKFVPNVAAATLGNQGNAANVFQGTNKTWDVFSLLQIDSDNISTLAVAPWSAASVTDTTRDYVLHLMAGPLATNGPYFACQRRSPPAGAAVIQKFPMTVQFNPCVYRVKCEGTVLRFFMNGVEVAKTPADSWDGAAIAPTRYLLGAVKLGGGSVANQAFMTWFQTRHYDRSLTDAEADDVNKQMVGAP